MNDYFKKLNSEPMFRKQMEELQAKFRPIIPEYAPSPSIEERDKLIETIKFKTGERKGFDLFYQLITGETPR